MPVKACIRQAATAGRVHTCEGMACNAVHRETVESIDPGRSIGMRKRLAVIGFVCLCAVLAGMHTAWAARDDRDALKKRVDRYWAALMKDDWAQVYESLDPGEKVYVSLDEYVNSQKEKDGFDYHSYDIREIDILDAFGWVDVVFEVSVKKYPAIPAKTVKRTHIWQKKDGEWYRTATNQLLVPWTPPRDRLLDEEKALKGRAARYWDAMVRQDHAVLYEFIPPDVRAGMSMEEFSQTKPMNIYVSAEVGWAEVQRANAGHGEVKVTISTRPNDPHLSKMQPEVREVVDPWVKIDGKWYRVIDGKE